MAAALAAAVAAVASAAVASVALPRAIVTVMGRAAKEAAVF